MVHFPSTTLACSCIPDPRALHESEEAVDDKFILQQFIWPVALDPESAVHDNVRMEWLAIRAAAEAAEKGNGAEEGENAPDGDAEGRPAVFTTSPPI